MPISLTDILKRLSAKRRKKILARAKEIADHDRHEVASDRHPKQSAPPKRGR